MSESSRQRIDDTPGSAGSVTEASDVAGEQDPAEQAAGPAESLPGGGRAPRPSAQGGRTEAERGSSGDAAGGGSHTADEPEDRGPRGAGVPGGSGGSYVDEFRPEPVRQVPSEGRHGQAEGPQATPDEGR